MVDHNHVCFAHQRKEIVPTMMWLIGFPFYL